LPGTPRDIERGLGRDEELGLLVTSWNPLLKKVRLNSDAIGHVDSNPKSPAISCWQWRSSAPGTREKVAECHVAFLGRLARWCREPLGSERW
jgi:hypothetical protein